MKDVLAWIAILVLAASILTVLITVVIDVVAWIRHWWQWRNVRGGGGMI